MRINLWGGPGAGKSTIALRLAGDLRNEGVNIEYISEYIKTWAYQGRIAKGFDQLYIFGKQIHSEDRLLQCGVKNLVTDSPILMQIVYARRYNSPFAEELKNIGVIYESYAPSFNVLLDREGLTYRQQGRYEREAEALAVDVQMEDTLNELDLNYVKIRTLDYDQILATVRGQLNYD